MGLQFSNCLQWITQQQASQSQRTSASRLLLPRRLTALSETFDSRVKAVLTFKVPQRLGWSLQFEDQCWTGSELLGLIDCLVRETISRTIILSLLLTLELTGGEGTVRSPSGIPPGGVINANATPWIQTFTGKWLDLNSPDPSQINIEDIAHDLSMLCRFNGQCTKFYSVAEHSVRMSHEIAPELGPLGK